MLFRSSGLNCDGFLCGSVFFKKPKHQIEEMYASEKREAISVVFYQLKFDTITNAFYQGMN